MRCPPPPRSPYVETKYVPDCLWNWPTVAISNYQSSYGQPYFRSRAFRNLLQLISRISAPPVISRPFEGLVRPSFDITNARIVLLSALPSLPPPLFFARGAKFGEQTARFRNLPLEKLLSIYIRMQLLSLENLLGSGIRNSFLIVTRFSLQTLELITIEFHSR